MSWQTLEYRQSSVKPVTVRLRSFVRKGQAVSLPTFSVAMKKTFSQLVGWQRLDPVALQVGDGEHAGRIRIVRGAVNAIAKVRIAKGSIVLNFGHVPAFGNETRPTYPVDARVVDPDTVEIVMPDWSVATPHGVSASGPSGDEIDGLDDEDGDDDHTRAPPIQQVEVKGVTITFDKDDERLSFGGREIEVTTRQAKFLAALAVEMPRAVNERSIISRVWGDTPPLRAVDVIEQMRKDLVQPLSDLGLDIRKTPIGYGLSIVGEVAA